MCAPDPPNPPPPTLPQAAFEAAKLEAKSEAECNADEASLAKIRLRYGQKAERLIAMMLAFDSLFRFREIMRLRINSNVPAEVEQHALEFAQARVWCCLAVSVALRSAPPLHGTLLIIARVLAWQIACGGRLSSACRSGNTNLFIPTALS